MIEKFLEVNSLPYDINDFKAKGGNNAMNADRKWCYKYLHSHGWTIQQIADAYVSEPILFAFDSYELSQEYDTMLIEMASFIKTNNAFQIFVDGHTDDSGKLSYNSKLSKRRALAVKRFLIKQGVKPTDFVVAYYGPEKPVATNDTREGRKLNRRVEIRLVPREK